jgi:DNA-binding transcriptional ArsR family regulator
MRLADGEASVSELAGPFHISLPAISKHIKVLEEAGLLFKRRQGRTQYCQLATNPLREIDVWLGNFRPTKGNLLATN